MEGILEVPEKPLLLSNLLYSNKPNIALKKYKMQKYTSQTTTLCIYCPMSASPITAKYYLVQSLPSWLVGRPLVMWRPSFALSIQFSLSIRASKLNPKYILHVKQEI